MKSAKIFFNVFLGVQVKVLSAADLAIGMHGSMLIMAMFLKPGSGLLELFPFGVPAENYTPYKTLAQLPRLIATFFLNL